LNCKGDFIGFSGGRRGCDRIPVL